MRRFSILRLFLQVMQGALIGLGSVLPGISGGVLSVVFGVYKTIMELLANPMQNFKTHVPKLLPYMAGSLVGFLGVANILSYFLNKYPEPSVCLFAGLIIGMFPSLWKEAGDEHPAGALIALFFAFFAVLFLLSALSRSSFTITPNFTWYLFCGFCFALSIIAPGMSFSTLLMPLGLYTPFVHGLGHLDYHVLVPGGIGTVVTIVCLAKLVNSLFEKHYTIMFHGILGIVTAATLVIVPFNSFTGKNATMNLLFIAAGIICALVLEHFNAKVRTSE